MNKDHPLTDGPQQNASKLEMSIEAMRTLSNQAVDILLAHRLNTSDKDAWNGEFSGELERILPSEAPETGRDPQDLLDQIEKQIFPFALQHAHPKCFGFIPASPSWPSVVADFLISGFNVNNCTWLVASGPTKIELIVIDWIKDWIGYPNAAGGLLTSGSSVASIEAFAAARDHCRYCDDLTVYFSDQTHGSLIRALHVIGIKPDLLRKIPSDSNFRMDIGELTKAVAQDIENGCHPMMVIATAGTTSTGSIDAIETIADICASNDIWFHVDAAYGGFACITDTGKSLLRGIERADSITLDAHKWFYQPYELGVLMVKDLANLENVYSMNADVLQDTVWGANHPNMANRGVQLSRSFRALKIWMSVQMIGLKAFRDAIDSGLTLARKAEKYIQDSPCLEILNTVSLSVVCFRFNRTSAGIDENRLDEINRLILVRLFWDDEAFISSTLLHGVFTLRICIINFTTTWKDIEETLQAVEKFGQDQLEPK